jgi:hypothetical protein
MPDQESGLTDRQLLVRFLEALREILIAFLERRRDLIPPHLHEPSAAAWGPVDEALNILRRLLLEPDDPVRLESRLRDAGLTGAPLQYKLSGFEAARARPRPQEPGRLRRWFGRVFGWADVVLGSLATVLPPAEVVKEYKEAGEQALADAEG